MRINSNYPSSMVHAKEESFFHRNPLIPSTTIYNILKLISTTFRQENAINCLDLNVTYQTLIEDAIMFTKAFRELGIKKGDIISIALPNTYQAIASFFAANRCGAIITFLNIQSTIEQKIDYLNTFESPLFISIDSEDMKNDEILEKTKVKNIITLKQNQIGVRDFSSGINNGYKKNISFEELQSIASYRKKTEIYLGNGKDNALILFTSGTTGIPKSVVITNENILASGIYMKNSCNLSPKKGEKSLVCVPFTYPYGFCTSVLMSLLCGREAILAPNINNGNISYYYGKNPNYVFGSPAFLELTKKNIPRSQKLSSVKQFISGGDFLYDEQINAGKKFFLEHEAIVDICNGSGNAESVGASTNSVGIPYKKGTVGKILVGTYPIIIDPITQEELPYGSEGELCISGKHIFKEYFHNSELTKKTKFTYNKREYIHTGTIGILDKQGYFRLTGRASRFYINSDLNKVYLERIQKIITLIKGVETCVAVPKPDDEKLYTCKIYVVPTSDITDIDNFEKYLFEQFSNVMIDDEGNEVQLKPYEIPTSVEVILSLPRNQKNGDKIDITLLEGMARKEYEEEKSGKKLLKSKK